MRSQSPAKKKESHSKLGFRSRFDEGGVRGGRGDSTEGSWASVGVLVVLLLAGAALAMAAFKGADLVVTRELAQWEESQPSSREVFSLPSLGAGFYLLPAGAQDPQGPHGEDEVYYIVRGRAILRVGERDQTVQSGSVIYVEAGVKHRFREIEEDIEAVIFKPDSY